MSRESYKAIERAKKIGAMSMEQQRAYLESEKRHEPESDSADCAPRNCSAAAEYLYLVAAKKTAKHCKGLIPWERVNLATRTGFGRLARWVISQGIQLPPNEKLRHGANNQNV